jgi:hypothetical protein
MTIYAHPSPYAQLLTSSSIGADIGTAAPCRTGFARTGVLRLGKRLGSSQCSAEPIVWTCEAGLFRRIVDWLVFVVAGILGGSGDWTTLRDGEPESGDRGRKKRIGTLRNG